MKNNYFLKIFLIVSFSIILGFTFGINFLNLSKTKIVFAEEKSTELNSLQGSFREVSKKILPTVIEIHASSVVKAPVIPFFFFDIPGMEGIERKSTWAGSGVIVGRDSSDLTKYYAITNNHVVERASELEVVLYNNKKYKAIVIGKDPKKDLSLISFSSKDSDISIASLGDSDSLEVGDWVLAIGSPFQFSFTVTSGIISGLQRKVSANIKSRNMFIQTDAAINQGNSGGPLVNLKGEVIGINTWIASPSGGNIGLGFAVPINDVKESMDKFLSGKEIKSAWLGVAFFLPDGDEEVIESLALDKETKGAIIESLHKNSPAGKSNLRAGDVIVRANDIEITNSLDLASYIKDFYAKESIKLEVLRGKNQTLSFNLQLAERPDDKTLAKMELDYVPGFKLYPLTSNIKRQLNLRNWINGVVVDVVRKESAAAKYLIPGDVIRAVNNKEVANMREFYDALNKSKNTYKILRRDAELILSF